MRSNWLVGALSGMLVAGPAIAQENLFDLSTEDQGRVSRGEIVVLMEAGDAPIKRALVVGLVDASPAEVFKVYSDFSNYKTLFGITKSEVIRNDGNVQFGRFVIDFPWPLGQRWTLNETFVDPRNRIIRFKRQEGTFKTYDGLLRVLPEAPKGSRIVYQARIDPDLPVPPWLVNWAQEQIFPQVIQCVRDHLKRKRE